MHDFHHSHIHAKGTKMSTTFCLRSKVLMVEWQKESFPSSCHSKHLSLAFLFVLVQHCQIKNGGSKRLGYIISVLCFFFLSFVLKQGLTVSSRLAPNSLCCPVWPQTCNPSMSISSVLGLPLCTTMWEGGLVLHRPHCYRWLTETGSSTGLMLKVYWRAFTHWTSRLAFQPSSHKYCVSTCQSEMFVYMTSVQIWAIIACV